MLVFFSFFFRKNANRRNDKGQGCGTAVLEGVEKSSIGVYTCYSMRHLSGCIASSSPSSRSISLAPTTNIRRWPLCNGGRSPWIASMRERPRQHLGPFHISFSLVCRWACGGGLSRKRENRAAAVKERQRNRETERERENEGGEAAGLKN